MGIKLLAAVTDLNWFDFLRKRPDLEEVNFWQPSPGSFQALRRGELFLFKLRSPRNMIAGGGVFLRADTLPCSLAWKAYGYANGAESETRMRQQIAAYRKDSAGGAEDFQIGCRILTQPFFFDEAHWIEPPPSWRNNIVRYKGFSTDDLEGMQLWDAVMERLRHQPFGSVTEQLDRYGEPQIIQPRVGQGTFRALVTQSYDGRCAVTRERTLPALEAAHILPYSLGGAHEASNGLLLRSDIHHLFDDGFVTVTPDLRVEVSQRIKDYYGNGRDYYALQGTPIHAPQDSSLRPDPQALGWHNENRFR